jgi:predicted DNA-binding protein
MTGEMKKPIEKREMRGNREMMSIYLRPEVADALRDLSADTDTPVAHYLREAAEDLLRKYEVEVPKPRRKS